MNPSRILKIGVCPICSGVSEVSRPCTCPDSNAPPPCRKHEAACEAVQWRNDEYRAEIASLKRELEAARERGAVLSKAVSLALDEAPNCTQGSPAHVHGRPGIWDSDSTPCDECGVWARARAALAAQPATKVAQACTHRHQRSDLLSPETITCCTCGIVILNPERQHNLGPTNPESK